MLWHFLFETAAGWISTTVLIVAGCAALGYFFPPLRRIAFEVAAVAVAATAIYTKGNRDRAATEQRRRDEAVSNLEKHYEEIERRSDSKSDLVKRLRSRGGL